MVDQIEKVINIKDNRVRFIVFFDKRVSDSEFTEKAKAQIHEGSFIYSANVSQIRAKIMEMVMRFAIYSVREMPKVITFKNFTIEVKITPRCGEYTSVRYRQDLSNIGGIYLELNYNHLLRGLSFPKKYPRVILKTFRHEMTHHLDLSMIIHMDNLIERLESFKEGSIALKAYFIIKSMIYARTEGVAEFSKYVNADRIAIDVDRISDFRKKMRYLAKKSGMAGRDIGRYYTVFIYGRIYYIGFLMCFFIGLALLKEKANHLIYLPGRKTASVGDLDRTMKRNSTLWIKNLPPYVFQETVDATLRTNYRQFIRLYEWACNELGLSKRNRVIWWSLFDGWKKKASKFYEKNYNKKVEAEGFIPV